MPLVIETTFPRDKGAQRLAKKLCKKGLAACVQMAQIKSSYFWQNSFCTEDEILLRIKTRKKLYKKAVKYLAKHHPYEVPEIIVFKIDGVNKEYKNWLKQSVKKAKSL